MYSKQYTDRETMNGLSWAFSFGDYPYLDI